MPISKWREEFRNEFDSRGFLGTGITRTKVVEAFITSLLKEVVEEIPDDTSQWPGERYGEEVQSLLPLKHQLLTSLGIEGESKD